MGNEKRIVYDIIKLLRERGAWVTKTHGSSTGAGLPDLVVCYKGRFLALEVKTPRSSHTATPRQLKHIKNIGKAGGIARIVVSAKEVEQLLDMTTLWA